jgi:signal transduction histidine kinase
LADDLSEPASQRNPGAARRSSGDVQGRIGGAGITIERQYRTDRKIVAFAGDLRQVFANLVSYELDASPPRGRIVIRVRDGCDCSGTHGVRATIADGGIGMSEEPRRRIFEPFFTTKTATGTGLGLWVSSEILRNHHARMRVRSNQSGERRGTVFSIFFPCMRQSDSSGSRSRSFKR